MEQTIGERMARGAAWLGVGRAITNAIGFSGTIVLVRLLGPGDFGIVAIGASLMALASGLTNVSPEAALIVKDAPDRDLIDSAWTLGMARALLVAALVALLAWPAARFYGDSRLFALLLCLAAIFAVSGLSSPGLALRQKRLQFNQDFYINVANKLVYAAATITAAIHLRSYWALVIGAAAAQVASLALGYVLAPHRPSPTLVRAREILAFTSWITVSQIVSTVNFRIDHLVIGSVLGSHAVGRYLVSDELSALPTREIGAPLTGVLFPALAAVPPDPERRRLAYLRVQSTLFAVLAPAGIGLGLLAGVAVPLIYGPRWADTVPFVTVLACVYGLQSHIYAAAPMAMAVGRPGVIARRDLVTLVLRLGSLGVGIHFLGLFGVVLSRVFLNVVGVALTATAMRGLLGLPLREQLRWSSRTLLSLGVMALTVWTILSTAGQPSGTGEAVALTVAAVAGGFLSYTSTHLAVWIAAGRPIGPEASILDLLSTSGLTRHATLRRAVELLR